MLLITVHQGSDWAMPATSRGVDRFHVIALLTDDDGEPDRAFQYEAWRTLAIKTSDHNPTTIRAARFWSGDQSFPSASLDGRAGPLNSKI